jgi:hypothetical protein
MGEISGAVLDRIRHGEGLEPAALARALQKALDEKHVLVYVRDPSAAALLRRQDWDGAVALAPTGDRLLVVDSNVGFNKMDAKVSRAIRYEVRLDADAGMGAQLTLVYRNRSNRPMDRCIQESRYGDVYIDMMERCYWDYVRVYVPWDSELIAGPGRPLPVGSLLARYGHPTGMPPPAPVLAEDGRLAWTEFFALEPGDEETLNFDYRLPGSVLEYLSDGSRRYRFLVQKQPGTEAVPFELTVRLPPGAELVAVTPDALQRSATGSLTVSTMLRTDQTFEVIYREGVVAP